MSRTGEKCIPSGSSPTGLAYLGCWRCQHSCAQSCEGPGTINNRWLASLKGGRVMSIFDLSTSFDFQVFTYNKVVLEFFK